MAVEDIMELQILPKLVLIFVQLLWTDSMIAALGFPERFTLICFFVVELS